MCMLCICLWIGKYILTLVNACAHMYMFDIDSVYLYTNITHYATLLCFNSPSEHICWLKRTTIAKKWPPYFAGTSSTRDYSAFLHYAFTKYVHTCTHHEGIWNAITCILRGAPKTSYLRDPPVPWSNAAVINWVQTHHPQRHQIMLWAWGRSSTKTLYYIMMQ